MENFYANVKKDENIAFFKGKVAQINPNEAGDALLLKVEDTTTESLQEISADLVVLATGMQPNTSDNPVPIQVAYDDYGFIATPNGTPGICGAGCSRVPTNVSECVQDGTAAALKAIQSIARR